MYRAPPPILKKNISLCWFFLSLLPIFLIPLTNVINSLYQCFHFLTIHYSLFILYNLQTLYKPSLLFHSKKTSEVNNCLLVKSKTSYLSLSQLLKQPPSKLALWISFKPPNSPLHFLFIPPNEPRKFSPWTTAFLFRKYLAQRIYVVALNTPSQMRILKTYLLRITKK